MSIRQELRNSWRGVSAQLIYIAALVLTVGMAGSSIASASTTVGPAAPVKVTTGAPPPVGGTNYYILNTGYYQYLNSQGANNRMTMGVGNSSFVETGNAMSYKGVTWYQWELSTKDGYCIETSSDGAAHLIMAVCNSSSYNQYFYNYSLTNSPFLSLESTVDEGANYGVWGETQTAVAVNSYVDEPVYLWDFQP